MPNEQVDPASGTLTVVATDLVLPGNAGFNLAVQRVYNSSVYFDYAIGSTEIEEDSWAGIGWKLHFGRILHAESSSAGQVQVEMGDGGRHPLYHSNGNPNIWTTTDFWAYNPATATLQLPNGLVYVFGRAVALPPHLGTVRYVTEIHDAFGNRVEFSYFDASGPPDGVAQIRQYLSATQVRQLDFTYDPSLKALQTMRLGGRVWRYDQVQLGVPGMSVLTQVHPPQGPSTVYEYNGGELTAINAPLGGRITYTYQDAIRRAGTYTTRTRVVAARSISGHGVQPGTWTFAYGTGDNQDTTVVTCPCGTTSYRFAGTGVSGDFAGWSAGTLAEVTVQDGPNTLEHRTLTWIRSEMISPDPVTGPNGIWSDTGVYRPLLASQATTRNYATWTRTLSYHTGLGNVNDYGNPYDIFEQGETIYQWRRTTRTFQYGFTPYLVGVVSSETVQENSAYGVSDGIVGSSWSYDLATGFLTSQNIRGFVTSFEPRPDGNVGAVVDGLGHRTTLGYDWGQVSRVQTPSILTTRAIGMEGVVNSETVGNLTTSYEYDLALRLHVVHPPAGANAIVFWPDDLHGASVRVDRGQSHITHYIDGFGREVGSANSQGLQVGIGRDACGRVTVTTDPFTTTPLTQGTVTQYDALGRVTRVVDAAGKATTLSHYGIEVTRTDANGHRTIFGYMAFGEPSGGRLWRVMDAANGTTTYQYAVTGALSSVSGPLPGLQRTWTIDGHGLVSRDTQPESGTTTYGYDAVGNLTSTTDANGNTTTLTYDADNRLFTRDAPGTVDDLTIRYEDPAGRVTSLTAGPMVTTFTYDDPNRRVTRTDTTPVGTFNSTYAQDLNGNLDTLTYPSGRVVTYHYDAENRLTSLDHKSPGGSVSSPFAHDFLYGEDGRVSSYVTGAVTHRFTFEANRPKHLWTTGGTDALDLFYSYDNVGNVTAIADPRTNATQTFVPDPLDRLDTATGPWGTLHWAYDAAGNRLSETASGGTTTYTYDAPTQRLTSTSGASAETFTYDNVGQLTSDRVIAQYTYSPAGRLTGASGSGVSATYAYDASGERFSRAVNGVTVYSLRSMGGQTLSEYQAMCAAPIWTRDLIYAGGELLGAVKAVIVQPTVAMGAATASVAEATGGTTIKVRLTTPNGQPLACPASVQYATADGTALSGSDFPRSTGTVTFPAGSASGSTQSILVPVVADHVRESPETFSVGLSSAMGAAIGTPAATTITILEVPPRADFDGDGKTDIGIFRASSSWFEFMNSSTWTESLITYGGVGDIPVTADYDGDGKADIAVFRPSTGTWYLRLSSTLEQRVIVYGGNGDAPVPADYDGDGKADIAVFRPSTGTWYLWTSSSGERVIPYGTTGDWPVPADYDGDGKADIAVFRPAGVATWHLLSSATGEERVISYGTAGDVPVPADYDGDGRADIGIFRASASMWEFMNSRTWTESLVFYGGAGDIPVPGDYDGDGKADIAVFRPGGVGTWYLLNSSTGQQRVISYGTAGDMPLQRAGGVQ